MPSKAYTYKTDHGGPTNKADERSKLGELVDPSAATAKLVIPRKLPKEIRATVRDIVDACPYMEQVQMNIAVRLARAWDMRDKLQDRVDLEGVVDCDDKGGLRAHPAVMAILKLETTINMLERALALTVPTRKQNASPEEREEAREAQASRMTGKTADKTGLKIA